MSSDSRFTPGTRVREKGKPRVMIVKGNAGLAAHGTRAAADGRLRAHHIVCAWRTPKGAERSAAFLATALEVVTDGTHAD